MTPIATGSGLERALVCSASSVLPRVETVSDDSDRGRAIHRYLETRSLDEVPDELRPACEAIDLAKLPVDPARYAAEVAFAYDPILDTGRELGRNMDRAYAVADGEIAGTADVIALLEDDGVFVADFKTGWSRRPRASESLQLRFYALAACRAYGRSRAVVQMIRVMEDGSTFTDEAALDALDLDSFAVELAALADGIQMDRKSHAATGACRPTEGGHCRFCPCFASCPAKMALLASAAGAEVGPLTPETAARAYERLRLYKAAVERAEAILKDYARATPIPLADGTIYGVRLDSTKSLDGKVAADALRDLLGDAAAEAITVEVTQAGIKRALKAAGRPAKDLDSILEAIKARGGLRVVQAPKLVAFKPKEAA